MHVYTYYYLVTKAKQIKSTAGADAGTEAIRHEAIYLSLRT